MGWTTSTDVTDMRMVMMIGRLLFGEVIYTTEIDLKKIYIPLNSAVLFDSLPILHFFVCFIYLCIPMWYLSGMPHGGYQSTIHKQTKANTHLIN